MLFVIDLSIFGQVSHRKILSFKIAMFGQAGRQVGVECLALVIIQGLPFDYPFFKVIYYLYSSVERKPVHNAVRHLSC